MHQDPFLAAIAKRMRAAVESAEETDELITDIARVDSETVAELTSTSEKIVKIGQALTELAHNLQDKANLMSSTTGHLREVDIKAQRYELAALSNLIQHLPLFLEGHYPTAKQSLFLVRLDIFRAVMDEMAKVDKERFIELSRQMQEAAKDANIPTTLEHDEVD